VELADAVSDYQRATEELLGALAAMPADRLDRHPEGEWSGRQIAHHLADAETHAYVRLRRLLADPSTPVIQFFDEAAWAASGRLAYAERPVEPAIAVVAAVRRANGELLGRLDDADLLRWGEHPVTGRYTLADWLELYTAHARVHAAQIREALES
jgi:hypothetical protein